MFSTTQRREESSDSDQDPFDSEQPANKLFDPLHRLYSHISSTGLFVALAAVRLRSVALLDSAFPEVSASPHVVHVGDSMERATEDVAKAIKSSFQGVHLIHYSDLPDKWRNNPFVTQGYRFIPIERWPLIILSLFAFHNETLNIHTHLIPFLILGINSIPLFDSEFINAPAPEKFFMAFVLLCLFCSSVWHTMSGCAHHGSMQFCAKVDYIGIGWLISASVASVVYYGFQCHPSINQIFLALCVTTGLAGNVFPFMEWFNRQENRIWRVLFFVALALSSIAPLATYSMLYSPLQTFYFVSPVIPSLLSYVVGLIFYVSHVPERFLSNKWHQRLDAFGGGSHCIWHCFIVLAVILHRSAIRDMNNDGLVCTA
ncbi:HlyIII-domain-containing protein [Guyanagaster necrorhizus]|uniref:HlyIII-domain-containing protein n=1 Tax=Guyanagaster necrorhizus TaxID=856835 RepID=A0A9P7VTK4_9AGAR|nr:HlyIII-domain-containing protein [Guyanagaster necrorhizus MCA 3950]KAG7446612.1 HlyIII-domain-containing protein [Guyanagaster necrorhizus MCA 3950]